MIIQSVKLPGAEKASSNSNAGNFKFRLLNTRQHDHAQAERHAVYRKTYTVSDYIEHALSISSFEDFYLFAAKLKSDCGFSLSGGVMSDKAIDAEPTAYLFYASIPGGWPAYYLKHLVADDPTYNYCLHNVLPLVWATEKDFKVLRKQTPHMVNAMGDFDIDGFVTIPTHGANTSLSGFRFAFTKRDGLTRADVDNQLPMMSLLSTFMHEAMTRVLELDKKSENIRLTLREKEILRWVATGLSTWAVSEKLHISENTVLTHMKSVHAKLGVKTRQHAVAKALSLNLI
ncbi:MAG TPA: LuxR C-terminal-related transcriptional regulator [Gammaproteobacteria bacterium]|jgi:DNA-binding CsgD family transcriptional regulator